MFHGKDTVLLEYITLKLNSTKERVIVLNSHFFWYLENALMSKSEQLGVNK